jgi:spore coat polysaccharide biosynthesis predicted glycosyltransferase SpsG
VETTALLGIVPARPGSVGVIGKNTQPVAGVPLLVRALRSLENLGVDASLLSNDPTARAVATAHDFTVESRPRRLDEPGATIDEVVAWYADKLDEDAILIVWQPTVVGPNLEDYVGDAIEQFVNSTDDSWALAVANRHILWRGDAPLTPRLNRQDAEDVWTEVGIRLYRGPAAARRPGIQTVWVIPDDVVDIDTPDDLVRARSMFGRGHVHFDVAAYERVGYGHLYRAMTVAEHLQHHSITFGGDFDEHAAAILSKRWNLPPDSIALPFRPQPFVRGRSVWVADRLDTDGHYAATLALDGWRILAIENLGETTRYADRVVNDMYGEVPYHGDWSVLRPEFLGLPDYQVAQEGRKVLVTMGGTDPGRLTEKVIEALRYRTTVSVIRPPGRPDADLSFVVDQPNMAASMRWADLVVTSGGRTVSEAAAVGVPTVVIAQNVRELTHRHLGWDHGNLNMGLGEVLTGEHIGNTVASVLADQSLRLDMSERSRRRVDGKGAERHASLIEGMMR